MVAPGFSFRQLPAEEQHALIDDWLASLCRGIPGSNVLDYYLSQLHALFLMPGVSVERLLTHRDNALLQLIEDQLRTIHLHRGLTTQALESAIATATRELEPLLTMDAISVTALRETLVHRKAGEAEREAQLTRVVARLREAEAGRLRFARVDDVVGRNINAWLGDVLLPVEVQHFLVEIWIYWMRFCYLRDPAGQRWRESIRVLQWIKRHFATGSGNEGDIGDLLSLVTDALVEGGHPPAEIEQWQKVLLDTYGALQRGEPVAREAMLMLPVLHAEQVGCQDSQSKSPAARLLALLNEGDWLALRRMGAEYDVGFVQLVLKPGSEGGDFVFFDANHRRVAAFSNARLHELIERGEAKRFVFTSVFQDALDQLSQMIDAVCARATKKQKIARLQAHERARQESESYQREATRVAALKRKIAKALEARKIEAERLQEARCREAASHLAVGALLDMRSGEGSWQRIRLAAMLKPDGRLILVSREGRKIAEMTTDALAGALYRGDMRIVDEGYAFEQGLGRFLEERNNHLLE